MKTVNVRDGHIKGNVFGCSNSANEGAETPTSTKPQWTSFVNLTGGTVDGSVYGAGFAGRVNGSVCINVGANAINSAPNKTANAFHTDAEVGDPITPAATKNLLIKGSVFGGSNFVITNQNEDYWNTFDITGFSKTYIDGTEYHTNNDQTPYMDIRGGLYGCGAHCESGELGREVFLRNYGHRINGTEGEYESASRTLKTVQRTGVFLMDNANINLSGDEDISGKSDSLYAVVKINKDFYVANASSMVLGSQGLPVYIDSIQNIHSYYLTSGNMYQNEDVSSLPWGWIGINGGATSQMYYMNGTTPSATALTAAQENVILFKGRSRMWLRYHEWEPEAAGASTFVDRQYYGELKGFFRMRADYFEPYGHESFAYARPKLTELNGGIGSGGTPVNPADGGFLSYDISRNFFVTDGGDDYTKSIQYPYTNVMELSAKGDMEEYRMWTIPRMMGKPWYVDGRPHPSDGGNGIGVNGINPALYRGRGLYPDLPKLTISADSESEDEGKQGIYAGTYDFDSDIITEFDQEKDVIYVVGAVSSVKEFAVNASGILNNDVTKPLKLYRYPGGHTMSNKHFDLGPDAASNDDKGPGPNYKALVEVMECEDCSDNDTLTLNNVAVDGLFVNGDYDGYGHSIPNSFDRKGADVPMVITYENAVLKLTDNTNLMNGYNNTDVSTITINQDGVDYVFDNFYRDADFNGTVTVTPEGETPTPYTIINGAALYVHENASVNVKGMVTIQGNKQRKMVNGLDHAVECNVYLPTFDKSLNITGALKATAEATTRIGITSPRRNTANNYRANTFSPVAVGTRQGQTIIGSGENQVSVNNNVLDAESAWINNNFTDDQNWFFVMDDWGTDPNPRRTTYYYDGDVEGQVVNAHTLYFGWTWANVARKQPTTYVENNGNNTITISSEEALAWLISRSAGMNDEQIPTGFEGKTITQTKDFDMKQYVWVPVGTESHPFAGTYDGRGHVIEGLSIEYLGMGDKMYKRKNYGMFGNVNGGKIKRTFLVGGLIAPESILSIITPDNATTVYSIGGLVGYLNDATSEISNSEAALRIGCPNFDCAHNVVAGGLVGQMAKGHIHSSMAMPTLSVGDKTTGDVGGLVGNSSGGDIYNSFVNAQFSVIENEVVSPKTMGGLLGTNAGAEVRNCYVAIRDTDLEEGDFDGLVYAASGGSIESCYVEEGYTSTHLGNNNKYFTPASSSDKYGYMYLDNTLKIGGGATVDTVMFRVMNQWVKDNNGTGHTYARWARPGLQEINDDLPVLLLDEYDEINVDSVYQGYFRSLGTYAGGPALQYGGPKRDDDELVSALIRPLEKNTSNVDIPDFLFIYGDVKDAISLPTGKSITQNKVTIHEDVSILDAGSLADFPDTYVGVTFDNSFGEATSTPGINYGLNGLGMGGYPLPRDWHMFSTPLSAAPLGFNYNIEVAGEEPGTTSIENTNEKAYTSGNHGDYFNNPWVNSVTEFSWLQTETSNGKNRYWMKGWTDSQGPSDLTASPSSDWVDGYFPSQTTKFGTGLISGNGSDEYSASGAPRYPYGMDFYTWNEPKYHWINFKRNGPNHWHSDGDHNHLEYVPVLEATPDRNEDNLIVGRGYMMAIANETFMQSHGILNSGDKGIPLTKTNDSKLPGWNLVGNPYHGYLDFDKVGKSDGPNSNVLGVHGDEGAFYVVYNADKYNKDEGKASTAFRYYPVSGSDGGDYADRYLHPHQGFYVKAKVNGETLQFTESMLVSRATVARNHEIHFRDLQPKYPLVNLYLSSDNGCADVTVIEFNRPEWNGAIKLKELRVGNGLFYGQHDGTHYAALFAQEGAERVPLWFEAKEDDIFTIKWNTANGDFHSMYLIDNIAGVQYDMLRNDTYTFEGHKGDYPSRFYIVFDVTGVDEFDEGDHNFVFFDGSQWVVTGDGVLDFIDVHGRVLWSSSVSGQSRVGLPKVACGVYLMRLTNSNGTKVQKVIINKI
jgi:hypothetical protein